MKPFFTFFLSALVLSASSQCSKYVVVEDFTNVGCGPCYDAHLIFEGMMSDYPNDLFGIAYHINYPDPEDPMYVHAQDQMDYVQEYYDVFGVPHIKVGGVWAGGIDDGIVQGELSEDALIGVDVSATILENELDIHVEVTSCSTVPDGNYVIKVVIVEDLFIPNPPQNWALDFTEWHNVFRKVLPFEEGESFVPADEGQSTQFTISTPLHEDWISENLKVIAFIQDDETHDILNAGINQNLIVGLPNIKNEIGFALYPNPTKEQLVLTSTQAHEASITIVDALGRTIKSLKANPNAPRTVIDVTDLSPGFYHCRLQCESQESATISFIVE